jgi:PLP dependent protein
MGSIQDNLLKIKSALPANVILVAVSKTHPASAVKEAYDAGQRIFGENKVQELVPKAEQLPSDIQWHLIGHLQSNKVKYIAGFVAMIHSVDSFSLLKEINKQAVKHRRIIDCLLQVHIAEEETKFGLSSEECSELLKNKEFDSLNNVRICGLMGMATNTDDAGQIRKEFNFLHGLYNSLSEIKKQNIHFTTLSMGMSSDYEIALDEGSTMIRVGSTIFGNRDYSN